MKLPVLPVHSFEDDTLNWEAIQSLQWTSYSLTFATGGGSPSLGTSTVVARYILIGKLCMFHIYIAPDVSFNGGTGQMSFGLPVASYAVGEHWVNAKLFSAANSTNYLGMGLISASSLAVFPYLNTTSGAQFLSNTTPQQPATGNFPMESGSNLTIQGMYETS